MEPYGSRRARRVTGAQVRGATSSLRRGWSGSILREMGSWSRGGAFATVVALLVAGPAGAEPCGDVPLEGRCDGQTRTRCDTAALQTEECAGCCAWDGNSYDCLQDCPPEGECEDECLGGPEVFGCSQLATHQWRCTVGTDGCTDRVFEKCADGEICDEADTKKCRPVSEVDLCGGVPASGKCQGGVFSKCVAGALEKEDCAADGKSCVDGAGCTGDCPAACADGESGCNDAAQAWICTLDEVTGCFVRAAKNCGAKQCWEGKCLFPAQVEERRAARAAEAGEDASGGDAAAAPESEAAAPASSDGGGCVQSRDMAAGEGAMVTLATLLGFLLFLTIARRQAPGPRRGRDRKPRA